jgi:hypothetical protein
MTSYVRGSDNQDSADIGPSKTWGNVGAYAILSDGNGTTDKVPGNTMAGSLLDRAFSVYHTTYDTSVISATPLSGTWRVMGYGARTDRGTLCVRIS